MGRWHRPYRKSHVASNSTEYPNAAMSVDEVKAFLRDPISGTRHYRGERSRSSVTGCGTSSNGRSAAGVVDSPAPSKRELVLRELERLAEEQHPEQQTRCSHDARIGRRQQS